MGRDCWIVWRYDEEIAIEGIFEHLEDAEYYMVRMAAFVEHLTVPPTFIITELEGGYFEQNSLH